MNGMPIVPVDDALILPRDRDLIVATHGRSLYILDDITPLEQLTGKTMTEDVHLFDVRPGIAWKTDATETISVGGAKHFRGENRPPGTAIAYYLKAARRGPVTLTLSDYTGKVVRTLEGPGDAGVNRVQWDLRGTAPARPARPQTGPGGPPLGPLLDPGTYVVTLTVDGKGLTTKVRIEADSL
jgi:hypothetical protein